MRSDAFDQQRELRMKEEREGGGGGGGVWGVRGGGGVVERGRIWG